MVTTEVDDLTQEDVAELKQELWAQDMETELESASDKVRLVAEGDSWFDYPPTLDLLDNLRREHGYRIYKIAEHGDTLENLVYGTKYRRSDFGRKPPQILQTIRAVTKHKPKALLFSGGGNDIAGDEFSSFLNHFDSNPAEPLRKDYVDYMFAEVFERTIRHFCQKIWSFEAGQPIVMHGYGYARPTGRAVLNLPFGVRLGGPWLRPALAQKNISPSTGAGLIEDLIDTYNELLKKLDAELANFHHVDFRDLIKDEHWNDELHLKSGAYRTCAERMHQKIDAL